jgi:hypothetical protein
VSTSRTVEVRKPTAGSLNWRPQVAIGTQPDRPLDVVGRTIPRRFAVASFLRAIPGLWEAAAFQPIPAARWAHANLVEGRWSAAAVRCRCGEIPVAEVGCLAFCACDRIFFFTGTVVLVANASPTTPA